MNLKENALADYRESGAKRRVAATPTDGAS